MKELKILGEAEPYIDPKSGRKIKMLKVLCFCGNQFISRRNSIRDKVTRSCGCLYKTAKITHSLRGHPLYGVWSNIHQRCYNEKRGKFENYGGRGIKMCDDWKNHFELFYKWATENNWQKGLEIDRINNNGNYEPENCRIVTRSKNNRNKRNNAMIKYNNEERCLTEWCEILNLKYKTVEARIRYGWTPDQAFK